MSEKLIFWGTGRRSRSLTKLLDYYRGALSWETKKIIPEIEFYIDSDSQKAGMFMGKKVLGLSEMNWEERATDCVIAIDEYKKVVESAFDSIGRENASNVSNYFLLLADLRDILLKKFSEDESIARDESVRRVLCFACAIRDAENGNGFNCKSYEQLNATELMEGLFLFYICDYKKIGDFVRTYGLFGRVSNKIKNISIVSTTVSSGGAERVVSNIIPLYVELGYNVNLITEQTNINEYDISSGAERDNVRAEYDWCFLHDYLNHYEELFDKRENDVVCFHIPYAGMSYFMRVLLAKIMGIRVITHVHTGYKPFMETLGREMDYEYIYSFSDCIITLSENDRDCWASKGINAVCIKNPIIRNLEFRYRTSTNYNKRKKIIWMGSIWRESKHAEESVYIMDELNKLGQNAHLDIVGTYYEEDYARLTKIISEYHLEDKISISNFNPNPDKYYDSADIFLMTSAYEGAPMVLLEAKSHALPIVMYDIPYLDFVKEGKGMSVVAQKDRKAAAKEILRLLEDDDYYFCMSQESGESFENYVKENSPEKWKELFDSMEER